ncbi:hypothetical protein Goarm_009349 [Gossypium armourianum]|uniref:Uncharacterized protein n=1 Tax=Gossypium armourianum TaxID=34283 RepID=A0A7J9JSJ2_9ROSI|nr:hypothetical protein [Gossypium armourianum]
MDQNNVSGTIPQEMGKIRSLSQLFLHENKLSGNIPSMGNLSNLVKLYLGVNELPSSITEELGMLRSLGLFGLSRNHLNGSIPRKLDGLALLYLSSNKLSGFIPAESECLGLSISFSCGILVSLKIYALWIAWETYCRNQPFHSPHTKEFGNCTSSTRLKLEENQLSGIIAEGDSEHPWKVDITEHPFA